jgi:hypothetical protein
MSDEKIPPWAPVPKQILRQLLDDRVSTEKYTEAEAYISLILDADEANEVSFKGYQKVWNWGFERIQKFFKKIGVGMVKIDKENQKSLSFLCPANQSANQSANGAQTERERSQNGALKFFVFGGLWAEPERKRSANGAEPERKREPTKDTDTDTDTEKEKEKEEPSSSPSDPYQSQNPSDQHQQDGGLPLPGGCERRARGTNNLSRGLKEKEKDYQEYSSTAGDEETRRKALITSALAGCLARLSERGLKYTPTRAEKQSPGVLVIEWGEMFFDHLDQLEIEIDDDIENLQKALERSFDSMEGEECWPTVKDAVPFIRRELYKLCQNQKRNEPAYFEDEEDGGQRRGITAIAGSCINSFWEQYGRGYKQNDEIKH